RSFPAAPRRGAFGALIAVLGPDVMLHADATAAPTGSVREVRGAPLVARGALAFAERARFAQPVLVNGAVGIVAAPQGRLFVVLGLSYTHEKISAIDVIADPERVRQLDIAALSPCRAAGLPGGTSTQIFRPPLGSRHGAHKRGADRHRWRADRVVEAAAGGGRGAGPVARGRAAAGPGYEHHVPHPRIHRRGADRGGVPGHRR